MKKLVVGLMALVVATLVVPAMPEPIGNVACAGEDCRTACDAARVACRVYCSTNEGKCNAACSRYDDDDYSKSQCLRSCRSKVNGCYDNCQLIWQGCRWACD